MFRLPFIYMSCFLGAQTARRSFPFQMQLVADPVSFWADTLNWQNPTANYVWFSFVVEDDSFNYISARFPGDVGPMAERLVKLVQRS